MNERLNYWGEWIIKPGKCNTLKYAGMRKSGGENTHNYVSYKYNSFISNKSFLTS